MPQPRTATPPLASASCTRGLCGVPGHRAHMTALTAKNTPLEGATRPHHAEQRRPQAIARSLAGDKIEAICRQMACAKSWLYQGKKRSLATAPSWARERTRRPRSQAAKTPDLLAQAVVDLRHPFALNGQRCGAVAIQQALPQPGIAPVPSYRTSYRILQRHEKGGYYIHQQLQADDHLGNIHAGLGRSFHQRSPVKPAALTQGGKDNVHNS
jgi:hypothetical protein